jgi:hypothetical protein
MPAVVPVLCATASKTVTQAGDTAMRSAAVKCPVVKCPAVKSTSVEPATVESTAMKSAPAVRSVGKTWLTEDSRA